MAVTVYVNPCSLGCFSEDNLAVTEPESYAYCDDHKQWWFFNGETWIFTQIIPAKIQAQAGLL